MLSKLTVFRRFKLKFFQQMLGRLTDRDPFQNTTSNYDFLW